MLLFLITLSIAFSAEPAVDDADTSISAAKEAREAAIGSYRQKLEGQKTAAEGKIAAAESACAKAKSLWLAVQGPLAATATELKLVPLSDVSSEIAAANASYRKELEKLKAGYDAKSAQALKDAKTSGTALDTAEADVEKIDAELKRLNEQTAKEEAEARRLSCLDRYGNSPSTCDIGSERYAMRLMSGSVDLIGDPAYSSRSRTVYLPAEFTGCFPAEVKPTETQ